MVVVRFSSMGLSMSFALFRESLDAIRTPRASARTIHLDGKLGLPGSA
jgi:hypothetical protein